MMSQSASAFAGSGWGNWMIVGSSREACGAFPNRISCPNANCGATWRETAASCFPIRDPFWNDNLDLYGKTRSSQAVRNFIPLRRIIG